MSVHHSPTNKGRTRWLSFWSTRILIDDWKRLPKPMLHTQVYITSECSTLFIPFTFPPWIRKSGLQGCNVSRREKSVKTSVHYIAFSLFLHFLVRLRLSALSDTFCNKRLLCYHTFPLHPRLISIQMVLWSPFDPLVVHHLCYCYLLLLSNTTKMIGSWLGWHTIWYQRGENEGWLTFKSIYSSVNWRLTPSKLNTIYTCILYMYM